VWISIPCWLGLLFACLSVSACDPHQDPIDKAGTWSLPPNGLTANDENLRTMVVNQNDLVAGEGDDTSNGRLAALPVQRLLTGHRPQLPAPEGSEIAEPVAPAATGNGSGGIGGSGPQ
jgi:hypothetical protein